jgi:hypothetical protein
LGSAVWVVNGFFVFLPELTTSVELNSTAGGWTAFVGGTLFEIGAYLMCLEALNRKTEVLTPPFPVSCLLLYGVNRSYVLEMPFMVPSVIVSITFIDIHIIDNAYNLQAIKL